MMRKNEVPEGAVKIRDESELRAFLASAMPGDRAYLGPIHLQSDPIRPVGGIAASPDRPSDTSLSDRKRRS